MDKLLVVVIYLIPFLALLAVLGFVSDRVENRIKRKRVQHGRRGSRPQPIVLRTLGRPLHGCRCPRHGRGRHRTA